MQERCLSDKIRDRAFDVLRDNKAELVELTYKREGSRKVLRILADTEKGITIDECARISALVGEALDKEGFMDENYVLEVSSPGLDRPLKTKKDFLRVKYKRVYVRTFAPIGEKKEFTGLLEAIREDSIVVSEGSTGSTEIPFDKISKAIRDYKSK